MKWISVKDKLPKRNQIVIFKGIARYHIADCATQISMGFIGENAWERDNALVITHWMPFAKTIKGINNGHTISNNRKGRKMY